MQWVRACPKNRTEIHERSRRLGCGEDEYGNNQYMCLPNTEKSKLVEFCYDGVMGIEFKGSCLESSNGTLIRRDCSSFEFGCPHENFMKYETYIYPACQCINVRDNCYKLDPSCLPKLKSIDGINSSTNTDVIHNRTTSTGVTVLLGGVIFLIMLCIVLVFLLRRKHMQIKELERNPMRTEPQNAENISLLPVVEDMQQETLMNCSGVSVIHAGGNEFKENNAIRIEAQYTEERTPEICDLPGNKNAEPNDNRNEEIYARKMDSAQLERNPMRTEPQNPENISLLPGSHSPLYTGRGV